MLSNLLKKQMQFQKRLVYQQVPALPESPTYTPDINQLRNNLKDATDGLSSTTGLGQALAKFIGKVLLKEKNSAKDSHHIVLKDRDWYEVTLAQDILEGSEIDVKNGPENRVDLLTAFHSSLHTKDYAIAVYDYLEPLESHPEGLTRYPLCTSKLNDIRIVLKAAASISMM